MYHHLSADFLLEEAHNVHYRSHDLEIICLLFEVLFVPLSHFIFGVYVEGRVSGTKIGLFFISERIRENPLRKDLECGWC